MPGCPRPIAAPPAGCTPTNSAVVSAKPEKMPMALEPPPTHAVTTSGTWPMPRTASHCARASSPMTRWNSRTIHGYGCGPITEPKQ